MLTCHTPVCSLQRRRPVAFLVRRGELCLCHLRRLPPAQRLPAVHLWGLDYLPAAELHHHRCAVAGSVRGQAQAGRRVTGAVLPARPLYMWQVPPRRLGSLSPASFIILSTPQAQSPLSKRATALAEGPSSDPSSACSSHLPPQPARTQPCGQGGHGRRPGGGHGLADGRRRGAADASGARGHGGGAAHLLSAAAGGCMLDRRTVGAVWCAQICVHRPPSVSPPPLMRAAASARGLVSTSGASADIMQSAPFACHARLHRPHA